jgi:hypothetical protein
VVARDRRPVTFVLVDGGGEHGCHQILDWVLFGDGFRSPP